MSANRSLVKVSYSLIIQVINNIILLTDIWNAAQVLIRPKLGEMKAFDNTISSWGPISLFT